MSLLDKLERFKPETKKQFLVKINIKNNIKKSHINEDFILEKIKPLSKVEIQLLQKSPIITEKEIREVRISDVEKENEHYETFTENVLKKDLESRITSHELEPKDKKLIQEFEENIDLLEKEVEEVEREEGEKEVEESESEEGEKELEKEEEVEEVEEGEKGKEKKARKTRKVREERNEGEITGNYLSVKIGDVIVSDRIPKPEKIIMRASPYYMNNRKLFIQKLATILAPYRGKVQSSESEISCDNIRKEGVDLDLLTHQEIVRDYLNLYTPYRGLLLYHGLGSGKTCSSIAIAEGLKSEKRVVIMTPASLKINFFDELKKCGDKIYKRNQYWEFISVEGQPHLVNTLSKALALPVEYIREKRGAWMVNVKKPANFAQLNSVDKERVDKQIDMMIRNKYLDINYNGLNENKMEELKGGKTNPFDHSVVVIDEAHNLVSRIVNKLNVKGSIAYRLYQWLLDATDCRVVLLTGTPIINYPHEIGVLFNILRGYIKTWGFQLATTTSKKMNRDTILDLFQENKFKSYDYVEYSGDKLTVTRNPFGFINVIKPVRRGGASSQNIEEEEEEEEKEELEKGENEEKEGKEEKSKSLKKSKTKSKKENTSNRKTKKNKEKESKHPEYSEEKGVIHINTTSTNEPDPEYMKELNTINYNLHEGGGESDVFDNYEGIMLDRTGNISDTLFQKRIIDILKPVASIIGKPSVTKHKSLPDDSKKFTEMFINPNGEVVQINLFKRRILGLTSYFRSAQEKLLPSFVKSESGETFHKIMVEMSEHQFSVYYKIRNTEREQEKQSKKARTKKAKTGAEGINDALSSSYRIFSRAACNFAFPNDIIRPLPPKKGKSNVVNINAFNGVTSEIKKKTDDYFEEEEEGEEEQEGEEPVVKKGRKSKKRAEEKEGEENTEETVEKEKGASDAEIINYQKQIQSIMERLAYSEREPTESNYLLPEGLEHYSPKFLRILENIKDPENTGLHLLYSQFRTIEGIGILKLILEANGFAEFKIERVAEQGKTSEWRIVDEPENVDKPKFILYTGTESDDEKKILRNIYNSVWEHVPSEILSELSKRSSNEKKNYMGEVIKLMMITSSGAEGINLRNTRFVHITEPYWNKSRLDQVIGRARRICSHQDLPEELRTVKVFIYISTLSEAQRTDKKNVELTIHDLSKRDGNTAYTTDEALYEISEIKNGINTQILKAIKETSIDCSLYNNNPEEPLTCYGFGKVRSNQFGSYPTLETDISEKTDINIREITWKGKEITDSKTGIKYAMNPRTMEVYDLESYNQAILNGSEMIYVGRLVSSRVNGEIIWTIQKV
jgi:hypothetical protein